ncbi:MAG: GNAT family N-acetyltransferase [Lachnospiraceae bacterium]|nr:GNAT family N-acetyltransferase [Lachnospiraceae bacterium]
MVRLNSMYSTGRLTLACLDRSGAAMVLDFLTRNKDDFERYEPERDENFYTLCHQERILEAESIIFEKSEGARYYIFDSSDTDTIIGNVSLTHTDGPVCILGYRVDPAFRRQGIAFESTSFLLDLLNTENGPDMFEADIYPDNAPSRHLAEKLGFRLAADTSFRGREMLRYIMFNRTRS